MILAITACDNNKTSEKTEQPVQEETAKMTPEAPKSPVTQEALKTTQLTQEQSPQVNLEAPLNTDAQINPAN